MKILLDMNLPIAWEPFLRDSGWDAVHCSGLKDRPVRDADVMEAARGMEAVLFTHELDFGTVVALAGKSGPSVFQVHAKDVMVPAIGATTVAMLRQFQERLEKGAIIEVDMETARARVVPIAGPDDRP